MNEDNLEVKSHHHAIILFLLAMQMFYSVQDNAIFCHLKSLEEPLYLYALDYVMNWTLVLFLFIFIWITLFKLSQSFDSEGNFFSFH